VYGDGSHAAPGANFSIAAKAIVKEKFSRLKFTERALKWRLIKMDLSRFSVVRRAAQCIICFEPIAAAECEGLDSKFTHIYA
jgi:hypothetical protein